MTLDEELTIYNNILEKFKDMDVIIKPHPRDLKNYNEIFPNVNIIDNYFPIELLTLININPTVVCSPVSTALLNFKDSEIYIYEGELYNPKLEKKYFYLPRICRQLNSNSKDIFKSSSVRIFLYL